MADLMMSLSNEKRFLVIFKRISTTYWSRLHLSAISLHTLLRNRSSYAYSDSYVIILGLSSASFKMPFCHQKCQILPIFQKVLKVASDRPTGWLATIANSFYIYVGRHLYIRIFVFSFQRKSFLAPNFFQNEINMLL